MPTPVGHSLMGYIIYKSSEKINNWKDSLIFIFVANFADSDLIPGYFFGNPNHYHHGFTHSLFFAALIGIIVGSIYYLIKRKNFLKYWSTFTVVYISHLILDFFGKDTRFPFGEQLFWPISQKYFLSPIPIFSDVHKASSSDIFIQSLMSWHNLKTVIIECLILLPILLFISIYKKKKK